jgi:putative PEP-CTERM system histidine kinase
VSALITFWSHALAAVLFATLLLWQLRSGARDAGQRLLLAGLLMTAVWAWLSAVQPGSLLAAQAETARNLLWVGLLYVLSQTGREEGMRLQGVRLVYAAVSGVLGAQFLADGVLAIADGQAAEALSAATSILRITAAAGALVLVHNLYGQAALGSRGSIRLVMLALALTWVYDLNLHTVAYLDRRLAEALFGWRGALVFATGPLFALGGQRTDGWRVRLSRAATFQSLSLLAICSYFAVMAVLATVLRASDWNIARGLTVAVLAAMTVSAMVLLPSPRARGWIKVKLAKHLFEHRYDYRAEWLRFAATLGRSGPDAPPLSERIVKALADIVDAPGGLLMVAEEDGAPEQGGSWKWHGRLPAPQVLAPLWTGLEAEARVLEFDAHRHRWGSPRDLALKLPDELLGDTRLWAGVPLIHHERLIGLVLLAAPDLRRPLDWEDFDLLRTAGRQAASSLAEAHGQQALMNAQRFEEFNRRFAFILHDVKNLVSQLSLLSRNAERHADNPEFRADMIATLKSSVGKMNELLARLSPGVGGGGANALTAVPLRQALTSAIAAKRRNHEVRLLGDTSADVLADQLSFEQAIGHLLQNAIDASPPEQPVTVRTGLAGERVAIEIADKGTGMDPEFVRTRLFQPFASTKSGGFGIGAYEARSLVLAMGGTLVVDSRPGEGTRFTIHLPAAPAAALRKTA